MKFSDNEEDWDGIADTPEEFNNAIENAVSENERFFFETLRYKVLKEGAFSNEVLMDEIDNEDGLYILRVCTDDFLIGTHEYTPGKRSMPEEYAGIFSVIDEDIFAHTGRHETLLEWLRKRDYKGIRYDRNNDLT